MLLKHLARQQPHRAAHPSLPLAAQRSPFRGSRGGKKEGATSPNNCCPPPGWEHCPPGSVCRGCGAVDGGSSHVAAASILLGLHLPLCIFRLRAQKCPCCCAAGLASCPPPPTRPYLGGKSGGERGRGGRTCPGHGLSCPRAPPSPPSPALPALLQPGPPVILQPPGTRGGLPPSCCPHPWVLSSASSAVAGVCLRTLVIVVLYFFLYFSPFSCLYSLPPPNPLLFHF